MVEVVGDDNPVCQKVCATTLESLFPSSTCKSSYANNPTNVPMWSAPPTVVLDIQKLAAEMGLKCITTYKLDALRSVQRINKSVCQDAPMCGESESIQNSDSLTSIIQEISETALDCTHELDEAASIEQLKNKVYTSKAEVRKSTRKMRNGPGRNNSLGGRVERSKGFLPNSFDRVLLDAPCSALGLRPRLFAGEDTVESLRTHAKYQRRMFDQAVQLVRPGGVIVYST
ncbi:UNVERIFIED_CONTAM: rRNA (cytosine-C(5))-methyltransferase NOP2C [Sesamum radiatum]|uniref:rRNA (Cytosine-C(5))-methyltransferase NOP2C n=1 Tax=Sesamum radiatum TaxID=300843 RepID=A0AAW2KM21_SESRA